MGDKVISDTKSGENKTASTGNSRKFSLENLIGKKNTIVVLILVNVIFILAAVFTSSVYSRNVQEEKTQRAINSFSLTVETMKQMTKRYFLTEQYFVQNWSAYIEDQDMTIDEAMEFLRNINTQEDIYAHIVDLDDYSARSTYIKDGDDSVDCYRYIYDVDTKNHSEYGTESLFLNTMYDIYEGGNTDQINILGKYNVRETQQTVVSVGMPVRINNGDGTSKTCLLLRVIPVETIKKIWILPLEYENAELGIIAKDGGYIIRSKSMKSRTFIDYIRAYNFQDDYNKMYELQAHLETNNQELFKYKNSKGEDCYWYYSRLEDDGYSGILGYIPKSNLVNENTDWFVLTVVCLTILAMVFLDGTYILAINKRLKETAVMAQQASVAKSNFLSSMSHDIRTPMNAILGMVSLAKSHLKDNEYVNDCLNKISVSGNYLLTLVNDILDVSKVESGKMTLNYSVFAVSEVMQNLINVYNSDVFGKNIRLNTEDVDIHCNYLIGDRLRLSQIYINLLTNAIKYTNSGGRIDIHLSEKTLDDGTADLIFKIKDTGIGMSEEFQKNMYDTFSRAFDSRINRIQGSGLGLAIVKQMTELMGGTVDCVSELGKGTEFVVKVNLKVPNDAQVKEFLEAEKEYNIDVDTDENATFKGMNVLVAEDNDLNWEIISEILRGYGIHSDRANNGQKCYNIITSVPAGTYDLIFMDVQMPVLDGRRTTAKIRACDSPYLKSVPIYAMTADAFAEDIQACFDCGMNGHISKPIDTTKLRGILRTVYNRNNG